MRPRPAETSRWAERPPTNVLSNPKQVTDPVLHGGDSVPVLPAIRECIGRRIGADLCPERRHERSTQPRALGSNEHLECHTYEVIPDPRIVTPHDRLRAGQSPLPQRSGLNNFATDWVLAASL